MNLTVTFYGLCAFAVKGNRVCVILPNCDAGAAASSERASMHLDHDHRAVLTCSVEMTEAETSLVPDQLTYYDGPLGNWDIRDLDIEVVTNSKAGGSKLALAIPEVLDLTTVDGSARAEELSETPSARSLNVLAYG